MIPVPPFAIPGQTLKSDANGVHVSTPSTDPGPDVPNGGFNFNPWWGDPTYGNFQNVIEQQEIFNQDTPTSVSEAGNLMITTPYSSGPFLPARV